MLLSDHGTRLRHARGGERRLYIRGNGDISVSSFYARTLQRYHTPPALPRLTTPFHPPATSTLCIPVCITHPHRCPFTYQPRHQAATPYRTHTLPLPHRTHAPHRLHRVPPGTTSHAHYHATPTHAVMDGQCVVPYDRVPISTRGRHARKDCLRKLYLVDLLFHNARAAFHRLLRWRAGLVYGALPRLHTNATHAAHCCRTAYCKCLAAYSALWRICVWRSVACTFCLLARLPRAGARSGRI